MVTVTERKLGHLGDGLATSFDWIAERHKLGEVNDLAQTWSALTESALDGVQLLNYPCPDPAQTWFAFARPHLVETEVYTVANGGLGGGPNIDLLYQLWVETDEISFGAGFALNFLAVPPFGGIAEPIWSELQDTCRKLQSFTHATRIVLFASADDFHFERTWGSKCPILSLDGTRIAGLRISPRPVHGIDHYSLCRSLASGAGGDPFLSGFYDDRARLTEFLKYFHVGRVLRIWIKSAPES